MNYDPRDWYWRRADGALFASRRQAMVAPDDAEYFAWRDRHPGWEPTPWPLDEGGAESDAALQEVLHPYVIRLPGSTAALLAYATDRRWEVENRGIVVAGISIATDDRSKLLVAGSRLAAMVDPGWSTPWVGTDGAITTVDATTMVMISDAVLAHVAAAFATYAAVRAQIDDGTITTFAQIDAADWPGTAED